MAKGGGYLFKWMPPLKDMSSWRRIGVQAGWGVMVCNEIHDGDYTLPRDLDYYAREVEKLVLELM